MNEIEIVYELVRQRVWTAEDLREWLNARCKGLFLLGWEKSRESAKREYELKGELR